MLVPVDGYLEGKQDAWLIGSGVSLKGFDLNKLNDKFTIAINHTIEFYPQAKALIFGDSVFLQHSKFNLMEYKGMIFASEHCKNKIDPNIPINYFKSSREEVSPSFSKGLFHPTSSGLLAINLALIMKAKRIFLLGYDYRFIEGLTHFYGNIYPHHLLFSEARVMKKVRKFKYFEQFKNNIINLNPDSLVEVFEKKDASQYV